MSIILTLTSTSERVFFLRHTLLSLKNQSLVPDKIIVNLSSEPYLLDNGIKEAPDWLLELDSNIISINWVENTGPYRKLLPTLKIANYYDIIITCDDDVIYGPHWLKKLVLASEKFQDSIICGRARKPLRNIFGNHQSYLSWPMVKEGSHGNDLIPIGVSGVLYRKELLDEKIISSEKFKELANKQDDLWFKFASYNKNTSIFVAKGVDSESYHIKTNANLHKDNTRMSLDNKILKYTKRYFNKPLYYIGVPLCDNDYAIRNISSYAKSINSYMF